MAGPGLYYPPPPPFVGGRQPYAPAQPLVTSPVTAIPANATLLRTLILTQIVQRWQPGPITILWSGPSGATVEPPPPPVPLPATSLGLAHLFPVLAQWQPEPIPLALVYPRARLPLAELLVTAPYFNTGQLQFALVLESWAPIIQRPAELFTRPTHIEYAAGAVTPTGGGRLIGPNRLARA